MSANEDAQDLARRLAEAQEMLQALLSGQVDAVVDSASGAPLLLRQAQEALQESEARCRRLVTRMSALVFELSPDGTLLFVNEAVTPMMGYRPDEAQGQNWWNLVAPEEGRGVLEDLRKLFQSGDVSNYELALKARDGSRVWLELNSANHYAADGTLLRIVGLGIDRTRRKRSEQQRDQALYKLAERVKELTALQHAARLLQDRTRPIGELLQELVSLLPPAFQYPGIAAARIVLDDEEFATPDYASSPWTLWTDVTADRQRGIIEVCYLEHRPDEAEGPFLAQERDLIEAIAEMLQSHLERRQAEKEREASGIRFRTLAETTSAAIFIVEGLRIVYANDAAQGVTGYACDELIGRELWELAHPAYQAILKQHGLAHAWADNIPNRFELKILTRPGEERWWDVTTGEIEYEGRPASVVTAFDITERDRAEKLLHKAKEELEVRVAQRTAELREANQALSFSNERLEAVLNSITDAYFALDSEWRFTAINPVAERDIFGRPAADLVGQVFWQEYPAAVQTEFYRQYHAAVEQNRPAHFEAQSSIAPGRWFETHAYPREGRLEIYLRDITERKQAEEALQKSHRQLAHVLASISDGFFTLDDQLVVTYFNTAAENLLGRKAENVLGRQLLEAFPEAQGSIFEEKYTLAAKHKEPAAFETYFGVQPYENWYDVRVYPFEEGIAVYFLVTTDRRRSEQERERLLVQAQEYAEQLRTANEELHEQAEELEVAAEELTSQNDELRSAQHTIEAERRRYQELFDFAPGGYLVTDLNGTVREANRAATEMLRVRADRLVGKPLAVFVPAEEHPALYSRLAGLTRTQGTQTWETYLTPREGESFPALVDVAPERDAQGQLVGLRWLLRDITERKHALDALRTANEKLSFVLGSITDAYVALDAEWRFLEINSVAEQKIFRRPASELMGKVIWEEYPQTIQGEVYQQYHLAVEKGQPVHFEAPSRIVPGGWFEVHAYPRQGWLEVYFRDITERKQAENEIASLAKFPSENPNPILRLAPDGAVLYANEASAALLQEWGSAVGGYPPESWRDLVAEALANGLRKTMDVECVERVYSFVVAPITQADYVNLYGIDITERKLAEEALQRLNRTLRAHSHSDQALMRATTEAEYMQQVCKIVVEDCGHAMVWIGFAEDDEGKTVRPVAHAGFEQGYLETLHITWADTERGRGPTGTAVRTGQPSFCRNMLTDPEFTPWRAEALKRGYASSLVLPLLDQERAFGALTIYFREPDPFTEDEINLLAALADDLAYGIRTIRLRAAHAQAEQALRFSEERYRSLVEYSPDAIFVNRDNCVEFVNPAALQLFGAATPEQVLGKSPFEIFHPDYHALVAGRIRQSQDGHATPLVEEKIVRLDGAAVDVEATATPFTDRQGRAIQVILRDITQRKQAEEKLEEARRLLQALMEYVPEGITIADAPDARVRMVSRYGQEILGAPYAGMMASEVTAQWQVYHQDGLTPMQEADLPLMRAIGNGETIRNQELVQVNARGQRLVLSCNAAPIRNTAGATVGGIVAWRDVSDLKQAEEALRASEERYRSLFNSMTEGFALHEIVCDEQGVPCDYRFLDLNPSFERLTGLKREEVLGRLKSEVLPDDDPYWVEVYGKVALTGQSIHLDHYAPPLKRHCEVFAYSPAPRQFAAVFMDITDRKRAERERELLLAQLEAERNRWQATVENMLDPVTVCDAGGRATYMNAAYSRMVERSIGPGLDLEERSAYYQLYHPDGALFDPRDLPLQRAALTGQVMREVEIIQRDPHGGQQVAVWNAAPLRDAQGRVTGAVAVGRDVTEQRKAEMEREQLLLQVEALARTMQHERDVLNAIMENTRTHLAFLDPQFNFIQVNSTYAQGSGYSKQELIGRNHFDLFPDAENQAIFQRVVATGQPVEHRAKPFEYAGQPERGVTYWDWTLVPVKDDDGQVQGLVLSLADVTETIRAAQERERLLAENLRQRAFLEQLMQAAPVGIAVVRGPDLCYEFANPYYQSIPGIPDVPVVGRTFAGVFPQATAHEMLSFVESVYRMGEALSVREHKVTGRPGRDETYWNVDHVPLFDAGGKVDGVLIIAAEVTLQVQARKQIEALAARDEAILNTMAEGVAVADAAQNIVLQNPAALRIHGFPDVPGSQVALRDLEPNFELRYLDGRAMPMEEWPLSRALRGETFQQYEAQVRRRETGETRFVSYGGAPVRDEQSNVVLGIVTSRDVTTQKAAEDALRQSQRQEQARRLELEALMEAVPAIVWIGHDPECHHITGNRLANEMVGLSEGTNASRTAPLAERAQQYEIFRNGHIIPGEELPLQKAARTGRPVLAEEMELRLADGSSRWIYGNAVPLRDENGQVRGAMGAFVEVTEIKLALEALRRSRDELELRVQERTAELTRANAFLQAEIVERKRAEQAVWAERQRFNNVLEMLPAYLVLLTPDYHVPFSNRFFRERFGESRGLRCFEYLFGRGEPCEPCETYKVLETMSPTRWEWTGPDGRNYDVFDFPFTDTDGSSLILEMGIDITEQKRAEDALRRANAYNRSLIEASLDPLVTIGHDGKITDVNLATEAATGRARAELVGTDFSEYFTEPDLARAGYQEAFREGSVRDYALELLHRDGHVTSVLYNASVYRDEAGRVIGVFAAARDITARKQAEQQLRLQSTALEAAANGIFITDRRGNIQWCNPALVQMTGYSLSELEGQNPRLLRSGQQPPEFYRSLWQTILAGQVWRGELVNRRKDGSLYFEEQTIAPVLDEKSEITHFVAVKQDVTGRKEVEAQNARLYEAELRARRVAETLSAANLALTQTLDLQVVMETLLDHVSKLVPYDSASIMLLETESQLAIRVARGFERWTDPDRIRAVTFDAQANPLFHTLLTTQKSVLVPDTLACAEWESRPGGEHVRCWLGVPLVAGGSMIGVYSLDKTEPGFFTQEHVRLAEALVGQAAVAIQNAWLFNQVRAGRERLQSLSRRLVEVQEAERRYVARELHDEAGQALTSLVFGLGQLEQDMDRPQQIARVAELKGTTNGVLESLHRLAMDLRPASLDHLGLVPALDQYVAATGSRYGLVAQFKAVGLPGERLSPSMETALYRIVQEALTNVVRYAHATRVDVLLERRGDHLVLVVEDNGVGFEADLTRLAQDGHLGLAGMQERAEMLGGSLVIETARGAGTTIVVEVPYAH